MNKKRNQLALRPKSANALRRRVVFTPADPAPHEPQYVVTRTALGEFALHWTAEWLAGLFCVTDLPAEWIAFVTTSIHGPWREAVWEGFAPFSGVVWDANPWEPPAQLTSRVIRALPP